MKKKNNVSSTGRDTCEHTDPYMLCAFVDQEDNHRVLENMWKPTDMPSKYNAVDMKNITTHQGMKRTDATAHSMYPVQNSTESNIILASNDKKTYL